MEQRKFKVVMLPTEKASGTTDGIFWYYKNSKILSKDNIIQHLYIISDEYTKEGEWFIGLDNKVHQCKSDMVGIHKKIIATTDESLTKEMYYVSSGKYQKSLPQLHKSFIQAYIKAYNEGKLAELNLLWIEENL